MRLICLTFCLLFFATDGAAFSRDWTLGGDLSVRFVSDADFLYTEADGAKLSAHLPGFAEEERKSKPDLLIEHRHVVDQFHLTQEGGVVTVESDWEEALPPDFIHLLYGAARKEWIERGIFPVHAACIGKEGEGYTLLVGPSGSGKTSLTLNAALNHGYQVFSGDKTLLRVNAEGGLEAIAGTHTLTVRQEDRTRWGALEGVAFGDRIAVQLPEEAYAVPKSVPIKRIILVRLNDGAHVQTELSPLEALHALYPLFLDKQREDILQGGGEALFDGVTPGEVRQELAGMLREALQAIPTFTLSASLEEITRFIDGTTLPAAAGPKKILFGICGIGYGHIHRQLPLLRHLLNQGHEIAVFTYGQGLTFFEDNPRLTVIPVAVPFIQGSADGLDFGASARSERNERDFYRINFLAMDRVAQEIGTPDLVISDYEPVAAQYAYTKGAPLVTIDQQSKYLVGDFPSPLHGTTYSDEKERLSLFFPKAEKRIAASFFQVPRSSGNDVDLDVIGPSLRSEILAAKGSPLSEKQSLLVYITASFLREQPVKGWVDTLRHALPEEITAHVFLPKGFELPNDDSHLFFYHQGDPRFLPRFTAAHGVIATAGHTLLSEAMYLEKPVYAVPLRLYEQQLNAEMIAKGGFGIRADTLTSEGLGVFLDNLPRYVENIRNDQRVLIKEPGNAQMVRKVEQLLFGHPLNIKVLLNAEPFGFGPSAAIAEIFPHLSGRVGRLSYVGSGHTLDLQRGLPYDTVYDYANTKAKFLSIAKDYDLFVTATDFETAEWAKSLGLTVVIYDPLAWYWQEIPEVVREIDLYIAQNFVGVAERIDKEPEAFPETVVIPPILSGERGGDHAQDLLLVNLGGLSNPYLPSEVLASYARIVFQAARNELEGEFERTVYTSSRKIVESVSGLIPAKTMQPQQMQATLKTARIGVMTSGLGNIYEASLAQRRIIWLPPANDSQGQQIKLLAKKGMVDYAIDWHEFLEGQEPIDYFASQRDVLSQIAACLDRFATEPAAQQRFRELLRGAYMQVEANDGPPVLAQLIEIFGTDGAHEAAKAILQLPIRSGAHSSSSP